MTTTSDVIILGAGSAGLSAAKDLARHGLSVQLIEAAHRIGGRAYSEEIAPNVWFDLKRFALDLRLHLRRNARTA